MWNEDEHTYEERSEYFKQLILDLELQNEELKKENERLLHIINEIKNAISSQHNPEDMYREDFSI